MTAANEPTYNNTAEAQFLAPRTHQTAAIEITSNPGKLQLLDPASQTLLEQAGLTLQSQPMVPGMYQVLDAVGAALCDCHEGIGASDLCKLLTPAREIQATEIPAGLRLRFLPRLVGQRYMLRFEGMLFDWAGRLCPAYNGGYWNFYELSNGGGYAVPRMGALVSVSVDGNGFDGSVTQDAFGVIVSLFALNDLAARTHDDKVIDLYHALRAFASEHAEAAEIFRAID
jgi:hypothetical protein